MKLYEFETLIFTELKAELKKQTLYFWYEKQEYVVHQIEVEKVLWHFTIFYSQLDIEVEFYGVDEFSEESKKFAEFRQTIKLNLERKLKDHFLPNLKSHEP